MSSVIAIWATAVATVDALVRISLVLAGAAAPGTARRGAGEVAADHDAMAAEAEYGAGQPRVSAGRTSAEAIAR